MDRFTLVLIVVMGCLVILGALAYVEHAVHARLERRWAKEDPDDDLD